MAPAAVVAAPPLQPPRFGLITSARDATGDGARWEGGFGWEAESCAQAGVVDPCGSTTKTLDADDLEGAQDYTPFVVWAGHRCSTFGSSGPDREAKARRLLAVHQHRAVEAEFWNGTVSRANSWGNPYLRSITGSQRLSPGGTSSPLVYALAALEEAVAECGGRSMIHCTVQTATLWYAAQAIRREGTLLLTGLDNIVVPGSGYDGSAPDGNIDATGATAWAYATGMVDVRLGDVVVFGGEASMEQRQNLIEVRAERTAAANFDPCCLFGVNVALCETFCDPGS